MERIHAFYMTLNEADALVECARDRIDEVEARNSLEWRQYTADEKSDALSEVETLKRAIGRIK